MYLATLLLCGFLTALLLSGVVHLDATRREVPASTLLFGIIFVAVASFGAFLVPYRFTTELGYLYFEVIKGTTVTGHPREFLGVSIVAGIVLSVGAVLLYVTASRVWHAPLRNDAEPQ